MTSSYEPTPAELLHCAYAAARGKRRSRSAAGFLLDAERSCVRLAEALASKTYRPGLGRCFEIHDPKRRKIYALPFPDRVVQHWLISSTLPALEARLHPHSFACRPGRGTHAALRRARHLAGTHLFVLRLDVAKFFPSIDHELLRHELDKTTPPQLRWLRDVILDAQLPHHAVELVHHHMPGDDLFTPVLRRHGLPIGSLTSQVWANAYLTPLDNLLGSALGLPFVRYSDDVLVFADDAASLRACLARVIHCAHGLRLRLHPNKTRLHRTTESVRFLGFNLRRDRNGHRVELRLHADNLCRMRRRIRTLQGEYANDLISAAEVGACIRAWTAHAAHGDTTALLEREHLRWVFTRGSRPQPRVADERCQTPTPRATRVIIAEDDVDRGAHFAARSKRGGGNRSRGGSRRR